MLVEYEVGTEPWIPGDEALEHIHRWLGRDVTVNFWHRANVNRAWEVTHDGQRLAREVHPYAFRAWANRNGTVNLLVDGTETPASILWLLLHELAHVALWSSPFLVAAFKSTPKPLDYLTSDDAHDQHPEEQMADAVADALAPQVGSEQGLNRKWWRRRVRRRSN